MNLFPVDAARLGELLMLSVVPDLDADGVQRTKDAPVWRVEVVVRPDELLSDPGLRASVEIVKVPSREEPLQGVKPMSPLAFDGLVARYWSMTNRSGVSLSAHAVGVAQ